MAAAFLGVVLLAASMVKADESYFADHALFKPLIGEWEASGELAGEDGSSKPLKETWTGRVTESGAFLMSGTRVFGDDTHDFEWEFSYNATTELLEGVMRMSTSEDELRLEVNLSEVDKTITLKGQLDGGGAELLIINKFEEDGKMTGDVKLTNDVGVAVLSGTVVHEKKGAAGSEN